MFDLKLRNRDIVVTSGGDLELSNTKVDLARQWVSVRLKTILREWFLDQAQGVDLINILSQKSNQNLLDTVIQRTIVETRFVTRIISYTSTQETGSYRYSISFRAEVEGGEVIAFEDLEVG